MSINRLSLGVIPAVLLSLLLALSWIAAAVYWNVASFPPDDPFTTVWASFSLSGSLTIIMTAIGGLLLSCLFPTRGGLPSALGISKLSSRVRAWTFVGLGAIALLLLSKGVYLFQADSYLQFMLPQAAASLSNIAAPIGVLAAGVVFARRRIMGSALMVVLMVCLFAYGTRLLAMAPSIFVLGIVLSGRKIPWIGWLIAGLATYWLLPIPLQTRSLSQHGLLPYTEYIFSGKVVSGDENFAVQLLGNVGFTAPIAEFTASTAGKIPDAAMFASINPLPEALTDWSVWGPQLRAHYFIPFSMIGEFANFGLFALIAGTFTWGLIVRLSINIALKNTSAAGKLIVVSVLGLSAMSALYITQYNTRSVSRILTILVVLSLATAVHNSLRRGIHAQTFSPDARSERRPFSQVSSPKYFRGIASGLGTFSFQRRQYGQHDE